MLKDAKWLTLCGENGWEGKPRRDGRKRDALHFERRARRVEPPVEQLRLPGRAGTAAPVQSDSALRSDLNRSTHGIKPLTPTNDPGNKTTSELVTGMALCTFVEAGATGEVASLGRVLSPSGAHTMRSCVVGKRLLGIACIYS